MYLGLGLTRVLEVELELMFFGKLSVGRLGWLSELMLSSQRLEDHRLKRAWAFGFEKEFGCSGMYICIYVYMYICIYVYMYVCIYFW